MVEKKVEPVKDDSAERAAAERARRLAAAKETISQSIVYFDFDKSSIKDEFRGSLMKCADALKEFSELSITVEGHCDERGTAAYNLALGDRRANAVKRFLVDAGVSGSKVMVKSWGEERPAATGHNEAAWSKNRRAEFKVQ